VKTVLAIVLAIAVAGCATGSSPQVALSTAKLCCDTYKNMTFRTISLGEPVEVDISEESPAFMFPDGRSFFAAFRIPQGAKGLDYMAGASGIFVSTYTVFMPQFLFLDESFQVVAPPQEVLYAQARKLFEPGYLTIAYWSGEETIPERARYLVMHTSEAKLGWMVQYSATAGGSIFMAGRTPIYVSGGGATSQYLPRVATGTVKLRVR
jgi:maltose operon periplasmic protein